MGNSKGVFGLIRLAIADTAGVNREEVTGNFHFVGHFAFRVCIC